MLYLDTPLAKAVMSLFERALPILEGKQPGALRVYIFGGCALHMLTNARGSADVDAELIASEQLLINEVKAAYQAPEDFEIEGEEFSVVFDQAFNNSLCPLHEHFEDRAIPLIGQELSPLQVYIAHPVDLAISKLGRFTDRDQEDISTLIQAGKINLDELDKIASEAIDYYPCDKGTVRSYLRLILDEARKSDNDL